MTGPAPATGHRWHLALGSLWSHRPGLSRGGIRVIRRYCAVPELYDRAVKQLPVVDEAGYLLGIVSRSDVLGVFGRPDDEIRREVSHDLILGRFLMDPARFEITVQDGIVTVAAGGDRPRERATQAHGTVSQLPGAPAGGRQS